MTASRRAVLLGVIVLAGLVHLLALRDVMAPRVDQAYADFFITHRVACPDPDRGAGRVDALPWTLDFAAAARHRCATAFGMGWNTLESWGLWSRERDATVTLDLAPGLVPHEVVLRLAAYAPRGAVRTLRLTADGTELGRYRLGATAQAITAPLPSRPQGAPLVLGFHLERLGSPASDGTGVDRRVLGIALSGLALR